MLFSEFRCQVFIGAGFELTFCHTMIRSQLFVISEGNYFQHGPLRPTHV